MAADAAKIVVMFAFEGAQILDVTGPLQILASVNDERPRDNPAYSLNILAERKGEVVSSSGVRIVADAAWPDVPRKIDTMIVVGGEGTRKALRDPVLIKAIKKAAGRARRIVSVCSGAFLLAQAGLLEGKRATTHWNSAAGLAHLFPKVFVEPDAIYIRDGNIWTSAGVTAGMDLALALVREDFGDDMALAVARRNVVFLMRPGGQSQFSAHLSAEAHGGGKLSNLLRWLPEHVGEPLDVPAMAARSRMSERNFARVFRAETGQTPAQYVECVRVDAARRLLTQSGLAIQSVAVKAGFGSEERMRRAFQRHLKTSPASFRARFHANGGTA